MGKRGGRSHQQEILPHGAGSGRRLQMVLSYSIQTLNPQPGSVGKSGGLVLSMSLLLVDGCLAEHVP